MSGTPQDGLGQLAEIRALIARVEKIEDRLAGNERAVFRELRERYAGDGAMSFEDRTLLEVLLRNVAVREDKGAAPG